MPRPNVLAVGIALCAAAATASADSPLTSTDLDRAYTDVTEVTRAKKVQLDQQTFNKLRAPATSYEIRSAMLSAIGWQGAGGSSAPAAYRAFLAKATGKGEPASAVDQFNLGFLMALADYEHPQAGLALIEPVAAVESGDQAVQMVRALVKAQAGMNAPNGWCEIWQTVHAVETGKFAKPMRPAAIRQVMGYIRAYQSSCSSQASGKVESPTPEPARAAAPPTGRPDHRLRNAASRDNVADVVVLLKEGVPVDLRFDRNETALMVAATKGHVAVVKALLDAHAKPDLVDDNGRSALSRAAAGHALDVAELLLARGAKPDVKSASGITPLFEAAMAGEAGIVRLLLGKRADPNPRDESSGDSAFIRAANGGHVEVLRLLLAKADVNAINRRGETALMHAARNGRMQAVELLLANGAKLDARNVEGMSAAAMARRNGHKFVAELLEKRGAVLTAGEKSEISTATNERHQWQYFPDRTVERCRGSRAGARYVEVCAESYPADRGRRFTLALRDPSALEPGVSVQTAKHRLIVSADIPAQPDEYLALDEVQWFDLSGPKHVILVPVVHGVPSQYDHGRASLYVFDDQSSKLTKVWDSDRCGPPCKRQTLMTSQKPGEAFPTVIFQQTAGAEATETSFGWNGSTLVPKR